MQLEQLSVDLSDLAAAEAAARRICDALPRDASRYLLINNAGTVHPVSGTDALIDGPAIAAAFNLNVTAVMLLTARFLAAVEDLKADRRVLNISSGAGRNPNAGWGVYLSLIHIYRTQAHVHLTPFDTAPHPVDRRRRRPGIDAARIPRTRPDRADAGAQQR